MKIRMSKKFLSLILSVSFLLAGVPASGAFAATGKDTKPASASVQKNIDYNVFIFSDGFENGITPYYSSPASYIKEIENGEHILAFNKTFDGTANWNSNQCEFDFYANYDTEIPDDSEMTFDVILPGSAAHFQNVMKYTAAVKTGSDWKWNSSGVFGNLSASDFKDLGNGYCCAHVTVVFANSIPAGLRAVALQLSGYKCNYSGMVGIDNVQYKTYEMIP